MSVPVQRLENVDPIYLIGFRETREKSRDNLLRFIEGDPTGPNQQLLVKSIQTKPIEASLAPTPVRVGAPVPQPGGVVAGRLLSEPSADQSRIVVASAEPMSIGQTPMPPPPSVLEPTKAKLERIEPAKLVTASVELPRAESESAPAKPQIANSSPYAPPRAHNGWLIQIGAFDREDEAREHLSTARLKVQKALAPADSSTERVQIGDKVLYRARFTGFDKETAATACQQLRRSDVGCIVLRN